MAAAGPHLVRNLPRPRETLVAVEGDSLPRAVVAVLAGRNLDADARLLAEVGDRPGDDAAAAASLRLDIPVFVRRVPGGVPPPAPVELPWLEGLSLPPAAAAGEPFLVKPRLSPSAEAGTTVSLSVDGRDVGDGSKPLVLSAGPHLLAAVCRDGSGRERGTVAATVDLPGPPAVLLVEEGPPSPLARALEAQGLAPTRAAAPPADLSPWAVVVLGRGAAGDAALEEAVRRGRGLLAIGGPEDGKGLGRFRGSPIERALPVFLAPPPPPKPDPLPPDPPEPPPPGKGPEVKTDEGDRQGSVVTLLLVVDTSGSMWGVKLEMARRAAAAAAAMLAKEDRFGLVSFSDGPKWEIPLGAAGDTARIERSLRALRAGGGTEMLPALQEARRALRRETTAVRHCVVLSDGETSPFGLRKVVEDMVGEGATLSTVGIGADFDARLLGNLSTWGKGRTFPAVDPETLPQVVTLDTERIVAAGKEARAKAKPAPDLPPPPGKDAPKKPADPAAKKPEPKPEPRARLETADPCALIAGIGPWPEAVPPEAAPEARQATTLALRFAGERGPALVLGRHGLGRTGVLTFDPADLAPWDGFPAAAARIVRGLAAAAPGPSATLVGVRGSRVEFEVRGEGDGAAPVPGVRSLDPAGDTPTTLPVERTGARRFAVEVPAGKPGPRTLIVDGAPLPFVDRGPEPPPAADPGRAARIAKEAGAILVEGDLPPWPPGPPGKPVRVPLGLPLLVAAAFLLAADTAVRRLRRDPSGR